MIKLPEYQIPWEIEIFEKNNTKAKGHVVNPEAHLLNERDNYHFEWTTNVLNLLKCKKVLDVGCYDGWLDFLLIKQGFNVEGIELSPDLVTAAMNYAKANKINYKVALGLFNRVVHKRFKYVGINYDAVLFYEVLEHMPIYLAQEAIETALRYSKYVLISLPEQDHSLNRQHYWTPSEDLILKIVKPYPNVVFTKHKYSIDVPANFLLYFGIK